MARVIVTPADLPEGMMTVPQYDALLLREGINHSQLANERVRRHQDGRAVFEFHYRDGGFGPATIDDIRRGRGQGGPYRSLIVRVMDDQPATRNKGGKRPNPLWVRAVNTVWGQVYRGHIKGRNAELRG